MQKIKPSGSLIVFLGALCWSLNAPIIKFLPLDSLLICALRSLIAALALAPFVRLRQIKWSKWMLLFLLSYAGLCMSVVISLPLTSAPIAVGMQYTATIWLFLCSCLSTRQFCLRRFIPVAVIFVGVVFFMSTGREGAKMAGNLIALSGGVFFACMTLSAKKAAPGNPLGLTALANLFTGALLCAVFPRLIGEAAAMTGSEWGVMLILGVVQVAGGYGLYNLGVQRVSAQRASVIALWEMILGPLWVALFLKEYPSAAVLLGLIVIVAGMLLDAKLNADQRG